MTPDLLALLFSPDLNLSPEARALIAHVATLGDAEIAYTRIGRFLQVGDERKLRRIVAEAEDSGWIAVERQTGKGHHPRFTFTPPKNAGLSDSPAENVGLNGFSPTQNAGVNAPSSPPPTDTPPPPTAREDDLDLLRLRKLIAPHDGVLDRFNRSAPHAASWPTDVWATYRPPSGESHDGGGTEWAAVFAGKDEEVAVRALVNALRDYAGKGKVFDGQHFRRFVRSALREIERDAAAALAGNGAPAARASPRGERPPADAQTYVRKPYRGLNR